MVGLVLVIATLLTPVNPFHTNMIYTRNAISAATWIFLGLFVGFWSFTHNNFYRILKIDMIRFITVTLITTILCFAKVVLSCINMILYFHHDPLVTLYYVGEILAWFALGIFFFHYFNRIKGNAKNMDNNPMN